MDGSNLGSTGNSKREDLDLESLRTWFRALMNGIQMWCHRKRTDIQIKPAWVGYDYKICMVLHCKIIGEKVSHVILGMIGG